MWGRVIYEEGDWDFSERKILEDSTNTLTRRESIKKMKKTNI